MYEGVTSDPSLKQLQPQQESQQQQQPQEHQKLQEQQHLEGSEKRDSFGHLYLSVDMECSEESSSGDLLAEASQVLGHRARTKRKQEEAFEGSSPLQQGQAEETCRRSPKPKKERQQIEEDKIDPLQTSSPKPQREAGRKGSNTTSSPRSKSSTPDSSREEKNADVSGPSNVQHPIPMSRGAPPGITWVGKGGLRLKP